jgi:sodium-dependent phosphate transporter
LLWYRGEVPPVPEGAAGSVIQDYYRGHNYGTPDAIVPAGDALVPGVGDGVHREVKNEVPATDSGASASSLEERNERNDPHLTMEDKARLKSQEHPWKTGKGFLARAHYYFFRGVNRDIVEEQSATVKPKGFAASFLAKDLSKVHVHVPHYDNKTEHLYSFLQV